MSYLNFLLIILLSVDSARMFCQFSSAPKHSSFWKQRESSYLNLDERLFRVCNVGKCKKGCDKIEALCDVKFLTDFKVDEH